MNVSARWLVIATVVALCVAYLVFNATRGTAEYYRTIAEARSDINSQQDVRVLGVVQNDVKKSSGSDVRFSAAAGGASMPVDYHGAVPDIFRPGIQVVMEGHMGSDGVFQADAVLAKCPSRFAAASPPGS